jgi:hypothetical protein
VSRRPASSARPISPSRAADSAIRPAQASGDQPVARHQDLAEAPALEVGARQQPAQVAVAGVVAAQQGQAARVARVAGLVDPQVRADQRLDAALQGAAVELDHREQVDLVGHGDRRHAELRDRLEQAGMRITLSASEYSVCTRRWTKPALIARPRQQARDRAEAAPVRRARAEARQRSRCSPSGSPCDAQSRSPGSAASSRSIQASRQVLARIEAALIAGTRHRRRRPPRRVQPRASRGQRLPSTHTWPGSDAEPVHGPAHRQQARGEDVQRVDLRGIRPGDGPGARALHDEPDSALREPR